ncbi:lactate utilization protein B [Saccharicrinis sp. GN24d3]|uniref:lactate utilization protein B n=1 Tax=Saccharicrinis sp. GN24d3 TaxID=3458416 RepID=UPI004036D375
MSRKAKQFLKKSDEVAFDLQHRSKIKFNISRYDEAVDKGEKRYANIELARLRAAQIKRNVLAKLPDYLLQFEKNAIDNGCTVLWAKDAEEAIHYVIEILKESNCKLVVKSKSMTTEEIEFNSGVESMGVKSVETDLGEYIVQIAGEKPYHIVTPAMHKSKEDIAALFHEKFNTPENSTPEYLTNYVRENLRENFQDAEVGVTGANFLIADKGAVAVTENEGNAIMSASFPKVHIAISGIEKVIPSNKDLGLYWPLLAAHGTGQQMTVYNSIYSGPKKEWETDGPEKMYVILLDNGRTDLYANKMEAESLACIRCGACLNACPIYKNVGGHAYNATYSGPIGSIITPHFKDFKDFKHLSFACSLCGRCEEVCPVKIPLPKLLLYNRKESVELNLPGLSENLSTNTMSYVMSSRAYLDMLPGSIKNFGKRVLQKKLIGNSRKLPDLASKSFSSQWKNIRT